MSEIDDVAGILDVIDHGELDHTPIDPVETEAVAEGADATAETETNTKEVSDEVADQGVSAEAKTTEEAKTEPLKTETQTDTVIDESWRASLPPPPADYTGPSPQVDEDGQIVNMTAEQYQTYQRETMMAEFRKEMHSEKVEGAALDAAEKILPELKTSPAVRTLVENMRVASILNGKQIDSFDAAKLVREAMGLAPAKIAEVRAEAATNAKTHIEVQKIAAVETSGTQTSETSDKTTDLQKRIKRGDDQAVAELLDMWTETGLIN